MTRALQSYYRVVASGLESTPERALKSVIMGEPCAAVDELRQPVEVHIRHLRSQRQLTDPAGIEPIRAGASLIALSESRHFYREPE